MIMKLLLSSLLLLTSISSFAQQSVNSIDLVLYSDYREWPNEPVGHFAKVEITRKRYDRLMKENLLFSCKVVSDQNLRIVLYQGQVSVHHKLAKEPVARCETVGCYTSKFEDLADIETGAINTVVEEGTYKGNNYGILSPAFYMKWIYPDGKFPLVENMPKVTVYDPKLHTPNTIPVSDTFYCYVINSKDEIVADF
jgi:hypothetical protein